ncbi:hypothetical protein [Streptomyces silvisoli]|uniref:Uncharacterized protein n=1 Tax=Streptomyces silvisoli TaxID=3034235 RepID=A0ABT5ZLV3_9ACTN|nr:hypothetical protein [Streptomyces silvisoli]MDF3290807.1 hypothetical protein [Streptomyces silvisoli]
MGAALIGKVVTIVADDRPQFSSWYPAVGFVLGFGSMAADPSWRNIGIGAVIALVITTAGRLKYRRDVLRYHEQRILAQQEGQASKRD